jgi:hypothetical protein
MKLEREKDISRYNNLFDLKLSFSCQECGAVANAYPPKDDGIKQGGKYYVKR